MQQSTLFLFLIVRANALISRNIHLNGLDFSDFMIMYHLSESSENKLRRIDLAEKMGLTASGVTRMLLPLEKRCIIESEKGAQDARTRYAKLTKAGKKLLEEASFSLEILLEDVFPNDFDAKGMDTIKVIETVMNNITEKKYSKEVKARWGDTQAYAQSAERVKKMSKEDLARIKREGEDLMKEIASHMDCEVGCDEVQQLIARHYENLNHFYTPSIEMYTGLADMYVEDGRFNAYFETFAPGLAVFMRDAMKVYCEKNA